MPGECQNRFSVCKEIWKNDSEKKWYCISEDSPQGVWDNMAERMLLEFAESGCPIFPLRAHCPEADSEAKDMENCRYTIVPTRQRLRLFFA